MENNFKYCDGEHERHGQPHSMLDEKLSGHNLHCPACDVHLTSLLLCPECGTRHTFRVQLSPPTVP
jgi:hypothetical protein